MYFDVNVVFVQEGHEFVLIDNFLGDHCDGESHEFMSFHWGAKIKVLMSPHMYLAWGVDRVLLMTSLAVVVSAVGVLTLPGKLMRLPSTVNHVRCFSVLWGR